MEARFITFPGDLGCQFCLDTQSQVPFRDLGRLASALTYRVVGSEDEIAVAIYGLTAGQEFGDPGTPVWVPSRALPCREFRGIRVLRSRRCGDFFLFLD